MENGKIKIVHILEGFVGGLRSYICLVLPQLAQKGFDVTLICSLRRSSAGAINDIEELRKNGIEVHIVPMIRGINPVVDVCSLAAILKLLVQNKYDIVHTHCSKAGALGRIAAVLAGIRIRIHSSHCFVFVRCQNRFLKLFYLTIERLLGRLTTKFVAVSQSEADVAERFGVLPDSKCVVINNGLPETNGLTSNSGLTRDSLGCSENTRVVTTGCRLVKYKGIDRFLKAAELCRNNTIFLIAGEGELEGAIGRYIRRNRLDQKVKMLGHVQNMGRLLSISDVVMLCSDAEGQPYLLLEAMRAHSAVVATRVSGNEELLTDGRGVLVDLTPSDIAKAIDELLDDERKRRLCAKNAYTYYRRYHRLEDQISKLASLYQTCVSREK